MGLFNGILFFLFFLSITFIIYMLGRFTYLLIGLKNDFIKNKDFIDIKNQLFNRDNLMILWFSVSYFLFFLFL